MNDDLAELLRFLCLVGDATKFGRSSDVRAIMGSDEYDRYFGERVPHIPKNATAVLRCSEGETHDYFNAYQLRAHRGWGGYDAGGMQRIAGNERDASVGAQSPAISTKVSYRSSWMAPEGEARTFSTFQTPTPTPSTCTHGAAGCLRER